MYKTLVCLPRIFSRMMSLSALIGGAKCPLAEEIETCIRQDRQAKIPGPKCTQNLTVIFLLITRCCFTLCKKWISLNSFLCIYNKNCHQANGDNRHLVPNVPICLGRDIRDMPIACARTHPDANKHARHIPMYRPMPPCGGNWNMYTSRSSGQNPGAKMHSEPDRDHFCWSRDAVLLCAKSEYL